jgi:hypothetical protein
MELADQQNSEASGAVAGAEIPVSPEAGSPSSSPASTASPASESPSKPEKPLSVREQITKSIEAVRTEEAKRVRDAATGKFVKPEAEKPAAANEIPKPATEAKPEGSTPEAPPSAWKGIWESMTPEARAIAVKRESEVAKGFDEYRTKVKQYEALDQVIAPARARFQQQGIQNDAQALQNILTWEAGLSNPATRVKAFRDLGSQLGIDFSTLVQSSSQAPSQAQDIPEPLRPVIDQFGNIVQQVQNVESRLQSWEQRQTSDQIAAFAKDKPHFDKVSVLMGQLMQAGSAKDLDSAYQQAIKIHPEVSVQIEAERATKDAAERERAQAEKAAAARRAAVSPSGRSPHGGAPAAGQQINGKQSVREAILSSVSQLREGQRA